MASKSGLRQRMVVGVLGYVVVLTIAVLVNGELFNEYAEQLVWKSLLETELDHFVERTEVDHDYRWKDTGTLKLYRGDANERIPAALQNLPPGVHDDVMVDGVEHVVLVRDVRGERLILTLDIDELEARELGMTMAMLAVAAAMIVLLGVATAWSIGRLVRPLSDLAGRIGTLRPDRAGERIEVSHQASAELVVIADALNDYLERNERFVERERVFINSASHELRTPVAVIAGAAELALGQSGVPAAARNQLSRIKRTAHEVEHLISLLLVLAKDPARINKASDRVALDQLLPEIVEDHRHLTRDKGLTLTLQPLLPSEIVAPLPIVQAAIANLLRNAIENSDRGEITVRVENGTTVIIEDPGHGMSPEEISAIYARIARGGGDRSGGGIGLDLISRICEHLAWRLDIASRSGSGTITTLNLSPGTIGAHGDRGAAARTHVGEDLEVEQGRTTLS